MSQTQTVSVAFLPQWVRQANRERRENEKGDKYIIGRVLLVELRLSSKDNTSQPYRAHFQIKSNRCRDWERERRNKFNQAIIKLGELIRIANKENQDVSSKDAENTQYPKIEIIQQAILFVKDYSQEKSRLKSEILALQVKLDKNNNEKEKKDVSTQISKVLKPKLKNLKQDKLLILKNCTNDVIKGKIPPATDVLEKSSGLDNSISSTKKKKDAKIDKSTVQAQSSCTVKPTKILPKSLACKAKGPENTIVVVPGAPYIIPQRPLLFPTATPTFVLLNPGMQPVNKSRPIMNRTSNDITKTTMVNILPISAFSRPMSATKSKKSNTRHRNELAKKKVKVKKAVGVNKKTKQNKDIGKSTPVVETTSKINVDEVEPSTETCLKIPSFSRNNPTSSNENVTTTELLPSKITESNDKTDVQLNQKEIKNNVTITQDVYGNSNNKEVAAESSSAATKHNNITESELGNDKVNKTIEKQSQSEKAKLTNILDSSLCENTVDGGNARLELAEELLAASPTAAFLMSFPLVSGNRADSPAEEAQNVVQPLKDRNSRLDTTTQPFFEKVHSIDGKEKSSNKNMSITNISKQENPQKFTEITSNSKHVGAKTANTVVTTTSNQTENPFLNLTLPSAISTSCSLTDSTFALDFDCNLPTKSLPSQSTYNANNNIFYKNDPFNTVKNAIYSTSSISSGHDFNSLGLYPCAMDKFSSKTKTDFSNVEDNIMKIGSSRLTYDIDLGWSHKGFDFVNCTTNSGTFVKDNLLNTVPTTYTTSYNPFNPEFHVPLVTTMNKKDSSNKPTSFADTIASFYSQTSNLWPEEVPFYSSNTINSSKTFTSKQQNYLPLDHSHSALTSKQNNVKQYDTKPAAENCNNNIIKASVIGIPQQQQTLDNAKYTKKSPSKMHINWMTSETRPMHNIHMHTTPNEIKEQSRVSYGQIPLENTLKKKDQMQFQENDGNYFPINIHNYSSQITQEEFPVWPSTRPLGTTEISIDPPPINLPTLVGDLALGPHDRKKNAEVSNRGVPQSDIQNCNNFLSVTQLMNRSTDNMPNRCSVPTDHNNAKPSTKHIIPHYPVENPRKMPTRLDNNIPQPCYTFNESKPLHGYDAMNQYSSTKKPSKSTDKLSKNQKHSYTAESLIRGGSCTQKIPDSKMFSMTPQKYADCNPQQDSSVAQVSHFPPIIDYSDNSYTSQQFPGTSLYNTTTNTISNSFYNNFIPGSTNLMTSNYAGAPFSSELLDYNQSAECNYSNLKYEEFKIKGNPSAYNQDKSNHKSSKREYSTKHKLECSKKDSSKKYLNKRLKLAAEIEDWNENNILWQNKTPTTKRHSNLMSDELSFPNYSMGNQMSAQYQPDIFNAHLIAPNVQSMGHNMDRSLSSFPATSRANFNLSTIFPEIAIVSAP